MRPPNQFTASVLLASAFIFGLAIIGTAGFAVAGTDAVKQSASEPIVVENGSTYDVSQTLQFNVSESNGTYEIRTESEAFVDMVDAENGVVTLDTSGMNGGTYLLIHHDNQTTEYKFTLESTETSTTTTTTENPAITVEDGGHYEIPVQLVFENLQDGDEYELRKGDERVYVDQFQATNSEIQIDTEGLSPGEYTLIHSESGQIPYQFTLDGEETTTESTTTLTTLTSTTTTSTITTLRTTTTMTTTKTTEQESPSTHSTTSTRKDTTTQPSSTSTETTSAETHSSSTMGPQTTVANRSEGYYPSVPGFGFKSGILALVAGGILLFRRH